MWIKNTIKPCKKMNYYHCKKDPYTISTDPNLLDRKYIHEYLSNQSYWAQNIPFKTVSKSIDGSCCFGMYHGAKQIGFARVITDYATFGYLCDVFIDTTYRGRGLSKWLIESMDQHPLLQGFRNWALGTKDAHGLYEQFGYEPHPEPSRMMRRYNANAYKNK